MTEGQRMTTRNETTTPREVVILGGGPAAHRLADALHARDTERTLRVSVLSEEAHLP